MWNEIKLYEDQFVITLPKEFITSELTEGCFERGTPDHLFVDAQTNSMVTVSLTPNELTQELSARLEEYYTLYQRATPNFANCQMAKRTTKSQTELGAFYYTSTTLERTLLNFFALTTIAGKELVVTMLCDIEHSANMGQKFMQVLNSIDLPA